MNPEQDQIIAFFPCVRFSDQIYMHFQGKAFQMKNWSLEQKLTNNLKLHEELHKMYNLITKLVLICLKKNLKIIIENPYSEEHYLTRYWSCRAAYIDYDRREHGDYYKKPTQYFFINREPSNNFIFEMQNIKKTRKITYTPNRVERSCIHPDYANRFIREFIL